MLTYFSMIFQQGSLLFAPSKWQRPQCTVTNSYLRPTFSRYRCWVLTLSLCVNDNVSHVVIKLITTTIFRVTCGNSVNTHKDCCVRGLRQPPREQNIQVQQQQFEMQKILMIQTNTHIHTRSSFIIVILLRHCGKNISVIS